MNMEKEQRYQWNGDDYAANSEVQLQWAMDLMEKLEPRGDEHLLDIGCGDGKVTAMLAARLDRGHVTGIDSSESMIERARKSYGSMNNLEFLLQDARSLPFEQQFDLVFSNAALHWIIDHRPVLEGIFRALKPGGRALAQMGGKGNAATVVRVMEQVIIRKPWQQYFQNFSFPYGFHGPEEYTGWLKEAGFTIDYIRLVPKDMVHADREKFIGWLRTTWLPYLQRVPEQEQQRFLEEVATAYLGKEHQGEVHTPMIRLEFLAERPG